MNEFETMLWQLLSYYFEINQENSLSYLELTHREKLIIGSEENFNKLVALVRNAVDNDKVKN